MSAYEDWNDKPMTNPTTGIEALAAKAWEHEHPSMKWRDAAPLFRDQYLRTTETILTALRTIAQDAPQADHTQRIARRMGAEFVPHDYDAQFAHPSPAPQAAAVVTEGELLRHAREIVRKYYPEMRPDYAGRRLHIAMDAFQLGTYRARPLPTDDSAAPSDKDAEIAELTRVAQRDAEELRQTRLKVCRQKNELEVNQRTIAALREALGELLARQGHSEPRLSNGDPMSDTCLVTLLCTIGEVRNARAALASRAVDATQQERGEDA